MSNKINCKLKVNGNLHYLNIPDDRPLLFVLRNDLNLKGSKLGCGLEQCGSCSVLVNGKQILSCSKKAIEFEGKEITTIEGLESNNKLSIIQDAFIEFNAAHCGYCTAGIIISITSLFNKTNSPKQKDIIKSLEGNLCRCGSHQSVLKAIKKIKTTLAKHSLEI